MVSSRNRYCKILSTHSPITFPPDGYFPIQCFADTRHAEAALTSTVFHASSSLSGSSS